MNRRLLKSKIHRARVTEANLDYTGSVTVDTDLLEAADILEHEEVHIYNLTNGSRLSTYAIPGPAGCEVHLPGLGAERATVVGSKDGLPAQGGEAAPAGTAAMRPASMER